MNRAAKRSEEPMSIVCWVRKNNTFWIAALTDPESTNGHYALRIVYRAYITPPKPQDIDVLALEILFAAPNGMTFVRDHRYKLRKMRPVMKDQMKQLGLKPREYAAQFQFLRFTEDWPIEQP